MLDRRNAVLRWEVSGVNEMLTQMEGFPGVFVASTNWMTGLDQAAMRRFDAKIRFGYLNVEQAWELLLRHCQALRLDLPGGGARERLARIENLTPGDFAILARQHPFNPVDSAEALVAALERECAIKEDRPMARIGFV